MAGKRNGRTRPARDPSSSQQTGDALPPFRVAAGLGDPEREQRLLSALGSTGDMVVAQRCLSADELVACVQLGLTDAVLVASDLHRLNESRLQALAQSRVPLLLLVPDPGTERWQSFPGALLPLEAGPGTVREVLLAVMRGEHPQRPTHRAAAESPSIDPADAEEPAQALSLIALASGHGSPGRTTVAVSLAAALGAVAPTILVDADLSGPSVTAYLDADPMRNISMLVDAEPESPRDWDRAIAQEAQPLHPRSPHGVVICGVPKPEMRSLVPVRFFERFLQELRQRYRYVILDTGADFLSADLAIHRIALAQAQQIVLVASADLVGLWHARTALGLLHNQLALPPERLALLVNGHDRRHHHGRAEIEWALGISTAAVIPYDHGSVQRALAAQQPLILEGRSRAGHALVDLAERIHGGRILLPAETRAENRVRKVQWPRLHTIGLGRLARRKDQGVADGEYIHPVS
jgi:MinD-like ATPase involved in chromosome partitioning or flagellar assembly